jgi:hypothetical protein
MGKQVDANAKGFDFWRGLIYPAGDAGLMQPES